MSKELMRKCMINKGQINRNLKIWKKYQKVFKEKKKNIAN